MFEQHCKNKTIIFDAGPIVNEIDENILARLFDLHPILHANKDELFKLTHLDNYEQAIKYLYNKTHNNIVVTYDKEGCYVYENEQLTFVPSVKVEQVDATGAGDSHTAGLIAGLKLNYSLVKSAKLANQIAAIMVSQLGAKISLPKFFTPET